MAYPQISVSCVASVYVRQMRFQSAGDVEIGHAHQFDHQTLVSKGSVQVEVDGKKTVFNAPHIVLIKKDAIHELTAMEDDTVVYCIHALRDGSDVCDIIDPASVPLGARELEAFAVANSLTHSDSQLHTLHLGQ